jgi:hypothetical protein
MSNRVRSHLSSKLIPIGEQAKETADCLDSAFRLSSYPRAITLPPFLDKLEELEASLTHLADACSDGLDSQMHKALAQLRDALAAIRPETQPSSWQHYLPGLKFKHVRTYKNAATHVHKLTRPPAINPWAQEAERAKRALSGTNGRRIRSMTMAEANDKAMKLAKQKRSFVHQSQREWAEAIGCSTGLVAKLPLWKETVKRTGRARGKGSNRKPKAVPMKDEGWNMASKGERDETLRQLIDEQQQDDRQTKLHKRL